MPMENAKIEAKGEFLTALSAVVFRSPLTNQTERAAAWRNVQSSHGNYLIKRVCGHDNAHARGGIAMAKQKRAKDNKTHLDNLARDFEKEWEAFCKSFEKIEVEFMTMEEFREPQEHP